MYLFGRRLYPESVARCMLILGLFLVRSSSYWASHAFAEHYSAIFFFLALACLKPKLSFLQLFFVGLLLGVALVFRPAYLYIFIALGAALLVTFSYGKIACLMAGGLVAFLAYGWVDYLTWGRCGTLSSFCRKCLKLFTPTCPWTPPRPACILNSCFVPVTACIFFPFFPCWLGESIGRCWAWQWPGFCPHNLSKQGVHQYFHDFALPVDANCRHFADGGGVNCEGANIRKNGRRNGHGTGRLGRRHFLEGRPSPGRGALSARWRLGASASRVFVFVQAIVCRPASSVKFPPPKCAASSGIQDCSIPWAVTIICTIGFPCFSPSMSPSTEGWLKRQTGISKRSPAM